MTTSDLPPQNPDWFADEHLPDIPGWSLPGMLTDAFREATTNRKGVVFIAEKGSGKSDTIRTLIEKWNVLQDRLDAQTTTPRHRPRLLDLSTLRGAQYRDALLHLLRHIKGVEVVRTRAGQVRKSDDELREELVRGLHASHYISIIVDEGELCSRNMLDLLRDIHSDAERLDPRRADLEGKRVPLGVGILLIGAPKLREVLRKHEEAGQRWSAVIEHHPLEAKMVPDIYALWFPGFADAITAMGDRHWKGYISSTVTHGKPLSLRRIECHARRYMRRIAAAYPMITTREAIPFDKQLFEDTLNDEFLKEGGT